MLWNIYMYIKKAKIVYNFIPHCFDVSKSMCIVCCTTIVKEIYIEISFSFVSTCSLLYLHTVNAWQSDEIKSYKRGVYIVVYVRAWAHVFIYIYMSLSVNVRVFVIGMTKSL